jgi:hypothetical protein
MSQNTSKSGEITQNHGENVKDGLGTPSLAAPQSQNPRRSPATPAVSPQK